MAAAFALSKPDAVCNAGMMLGNTLVTTIGAEGKEVKRSYIKRCAIARELYLALLVDRATSRISVIASTEGGMDIEDAAEKTPEAIHSFIDPVTGLMPIWRVKLPLR